MLDEAGSTLPDRAFVDWVHWAPFATVKCFGKLGKVHHGCFSSNTRKKKVLSSQYIGNGA